MIEKLEYQKQKLIDFFCSEITSEYVYIDVPLYLNIGDWLIALGAWELLKDIPFRCVGRWRWEDVEKQKISPKTIILFNGGGNFGDLYRGATEGRNEIIKLFPNNKIIILPQTITYIDQELLKSDVELLAKHNNLHICARDNQSFQLLLKYFGRNKLYLLPDTALGLYKVVSQKKRIDEGDILIINRRDKEVAELFLEQSDAKDWNDILGDIYFGIVWIPYRILHKMKKFFNLKFLRKMENKYMLKILYPFIEKYIPKYFRKYRLIKTTRLHGYLLAQILHIPVEILDNKHMKISNYINTWKNE